MDVQIKLDQGTGSIEVISGKDELDMELSMGLTVECLELNTGQVYLIEMINGEMKASSVSEMA